MNFLAGLGHMGRGFTGTVYQNNLFDKWGPGGLYEARRLSEAAFKEASNPARSYSPGQAEELHQLADARDSGGNPLNDVEYKGDGYVVTPRAGGLARTIQPGQYTMFGQTYDRAPTEVERDYALNQALGGIMAARDPVMAMQFRNAARALNHAQEDREYTLLQRSRDEEAYQRQRDRDAAYQAMQRVADPKARQEGLQAVMAQYSDPVEYDKWRVDQLTLQAKETQAAATKALREGGLRGLAKWYSTQDDGYDFVPKYDGKGGVVLQHINQKTGRVEEEVPMVSEGEAITYLMGRYMGDPNVFINLQKAADARAREAAEMARLQQQTRASAGGGGARGGGGGSGAGVAVAQVTPKDRAAIIDGAANLWGAHYEENSGKPVARNQNDMAQVTTTARLHMAKIADSLVMNGIHPTPELVFSLYADRKLRPERGEWGAEFRAPDGKTHFVPLGSVPKPAPKKAAPKPSDRPPATDAGLLRTPPMPLFFYR